MKRELLHGMSQLNHLQTLTGHTDRAWNIAWSPSGMNASVMVDSLIARITYDLHALPEAPGFTRQRPLARVQRAIVATGACAGTMHDLSTSHETRFNWTFRGLKSFLQDLYNAH